MKRYLVVALLLLSCFSFAHLAGEAKVAGPYRIEFSVLDEEVKSGANADVVVAVENSTGGRLAGKKLWLAVSKDSKLLLSLPDLATDDFGVAKLNYIFPDAGKYVVDATVDGFKASFDLDVAEGRPVPLYIAATAAIFLIIGVVVGIIMGRMLHARKK